ncbi:unnamed protein product [Lampetra planeri]
MSTWSVGQTSTGLGFSFTKQVRIQKSRWFRSRRMLSPGFHMEILKPYVSLMVESTRVLMICRSWIILFSHLRTHCQPGPPHNPDK